MGGCDLARAEALLEELLTALRDGDPPNGPAGPRPAVSVESLQAVLEIQRLARRIQLEALREFVRNATSGPPAPAAGRRPIQQRPVERRRRKGR